MNLPEQNSTRYARDTKAFRSSMVGYFRQQKKRLLDAFATTNNFNLFVSTIPTIIQEQPLFDRYQTLYLKRGRKYYNSQVKALETPEKNFALFPEGYDLNDPYVQAMQTHLTTEIASRVTQVYGVTIEVAQASVRKSIIEAFEKGLSIPNTRKLIEQNLNSDWATMTRNRATLIARTETLSLANFSSYAGAVSTGLDLNKVWMHGVFRRGIPREAHVAMDGVQVDINEDFILPDGTRMSYPGDPRGGAENVCNCGCTVGYALKPDLSNT